MLAARIVVNDTTNGRGRIRALGLSSSISSASRSSRSAYGSGNALQATTRVLYAYTALQHRKRRSQR